MEGMKWIDVTELRDVPDTSEIDISRGPMIEPSSARTVRSFKVVE